MKKITKISKIFLVLVTIFSQLSSVITVLADEIISKPLTLTLEQIFDYENGYTDHYELTYISEKNDYEETEFVDDVEIDKTYDIRLTTKFTYLNNETTEEKIDLIEDVTGKILNSTRSSYELDPISKYYDGLFNLRVEVLDDTDVVYETEIPYSVNNSYKGLIGSLNEGEILPGSEDINNETAASYDVTEGKEYTQHLILMGGELSPNSTYKFVYNDGTMSEEMTGEEVSTIMLEGSITDLTGKLYGQYSYTDTITLVEVVDEEVVNTYEYSYSSTINYKTSEDNDTLFNSIYNNLVFNDGYVFVNAKGLYNTESVITIKEMLDALNDYNISLEVYDEDENLLDLTDEMVLSLELKNGYQVKFVNGAESIYTVIVRGDNTLDNTFNAEDMIPTMEDYLNEKLVPSMDMVTNENEEFGTITFEDIMYANELLKEDGNIDKVEEDNKNLSLSFDEELSKVYVGDTFDLTLSLKSDEVDDYIDGIRGLISTNENLKLTSIKFNDNLIGTFNSDGKFVGVGLPLSLDDEVIMTLSFVATKEGTGTIELEGETAKYLNISAFDKLIKEIEVIRNISTNNNLASLNASVGTFDISFDSDVTVYTLTVPYDTKSVILSGALSDIYSSAEGLIEYQLTEDKTTAIITVTAEDGSVKTYTVYIVKEAKKVAEPIVYNYSSNNYLKLLEIDGYEVKFDKEVYEYKIKVKSDVTSLDIKALAEDYRSRVEITGNENFKKGENVVTITVTAENGTTKEYKIVVEKEAEKKGAITEIEDSSNTAEKVVIIILIILVVLGLLYLIFKKDEEENLDTLEKKTTSGKKEKSKK